MKTSTLIIATALSFAAAAGAQADTRSNAHAAAVQAAHSADPYADSAGSGVLMLQSNTDRASVRAEALAAARTKDPLSAAASSAVAPQPTSSLTRATVHAQAVAEARSSSLNLSETSSSYFNSVAPATLNPAGAVRSRQAGL